MLESKARPNRLGPWGWLGKGKWGLDRYLYALHRLTGLAILFYFLLHILFTSSRAFGQRVGAIRRHGNTTANTGEQRGD